MLDVFIFGFGFVVVLVIGSGLTTLIVIKNRAADRELEAKDTAANRASHATASTSSKSLGSVPSARN